ncbi:hypothetical protein NQZ68_005135 [Dissostichus eleginoides]|nr:hypothetical protein NQZ68_005135 [Dissostichus eleginoides]
MCRGVLESFRLANKPVPKTLYIDRGCCRAQGPTSVETMFQAWFDGGMVVRLDIFHWIHRFDTAIRTTINNVDLPYYKSLRGSNSLEGFHKSLPHMIPVWRYSLKCPRGDNCVGSGRNVHLSKSGYHSKVRLICGVSGWYTVITEVLSCGPCTKAARSKEGVSVGRWLAWGNAILSQLSEAHQAIFPAVLTTMRGVDRNVVRLLRDRTEGNTMEKVWRQVQENHGGQSPHQALLPDGGQRVRLRVQEVQTLKYEPSLL